MVKEVIKRTLWTRREEEILKGLIEKMHRGELSFEDVYPVFVKRSSDAVYRKARRLGWKGRVEEKCFINKNILDQFQVPYELKEV